MLQSFKSFKQAVEITLFVLAFCAVGTVIAFAAMQRQNELLQEQLILQNDEIRQLKYNLFLVDQRLKKDEQNMYLLVNELFHSN